MKNGPVRDLNRKMRQAESPIRREKMAFTADPDGLAMAALRVVAGMDDTHFAPDNSITREEAATMLTRLAKVLDGALPYGAVLDFTDDDEISSWAYYAVLFVSNTVDEGTGLEVMRGTSDTQFDPKGVYTREQAFISFGRLYNALGKCSLSDTHTERFSSGDGLTIIEERGYLTNYQPFYPDGCRALWMLYDEEEGAAGGTVTVLNGQTRLSESDYEVWVRPVGDEPFSMYRGRPGGIVSEGAGIGLVTVQSAIYGEVWETFYACSAGTGSAYLLGMDTDMPVRKIDGADANMYTAGICPP